MNPLTMYIQSAQLIISPGICPSNLLLLMDYYSTPACPDTHHIVIAPTGSTPVYNFGGVALGPAGYQDPQPGKKEKKHNVAHTHRYIDLSLSLSLSLSLYIYIYIYI